MLLYDVSPHEGFNLRRDVYLRVAVASHLQAHPPLLALPPFSRIPHWRPQPPLCWKHFFEVNRLKEYIPVTELQDAIPPTGLVLDRLYRLTHFEDAFEGGRFVDKFELRNSSSCRSYTHFWGLNIRFRNEQCVAFQGSASKIFELIAQHPKDRSVMITDAEILLHDEYGTAEYWSARKSIQFSEKLIQIANVFITDKLGCDDIKCFNFISIHWRRGDFARGRPNQVPSVVSTAKQIIAIAVRPEINLKLIFIATDADEREYLELENSLMDYGFTVVRFNPENMHYAEGVAAIIDQIICSRAAFFVGTHESTFTFRIQEEREIMGFDSSTTFNRLCPDTGPCERPSRWKIVQ